MDRIHRLNQTEDVDIYFQIFRGTQYEKMWDIVLRKTLVIDQVIKKKTKNNMEYFIKDETWMLNPNEKVVKGITKGLERNNGHCPCHNTGEDTLCPCSNYRLHDHCCCNLYVKKPKDFIVNEYVTYDKKYICDGNNLTMFETDVTTIA